MCLTRQPLCADSLGMQDEGLERFGRGGIKDERFVPPFREAAQVGPGLPSSPDDGAAPFEKDLQSDPRLDEEFGRARAGGERCRHDPSKMVDIHR